MNPLLDIINEVVEEEQFSIKTDESAEWALSKIREEQAEVQRFVNVCKSQILYYEQQLKQAQDALEQKTGNLKLLLFEYFQTVPKKSSKTQETYKLPSGTLKLKYPKPDYVRDEEKLVEWLKKMGHTEYVKTVETPVWGEFKKTTKTHKEPITDEETGEITGYETCVTDAKGIKVGGITLEEKPPIFEVEV